MVLVDDADPFDELDADDSEVADVAESALVDESPVLAEGFDEPLAEDMVFAIEPKKGVPGVGMVGSENTYRVTPDGGVSLN